MSEAPLRTALITGASSGIGFQLARLFARDRWNLVLVARNDERLSEIARDLETAHGIRATVIVKDLAAPRAAREIFEEVQREGILIEALVNNAGFGIAGRFAEIPLERTMSQLAVHVTALTELTRLFLPQMLERKRGRILNVASTAGFQAGPLMATYYATKAFQISFSEALANEVSGSGVTVSVLCPGPTETNFQAHAGTHRSKLFQAVMMDAVTVARAGYNGMMRGKPFIVPGVLNKVHLQVVRLLPRRLIPHLVRAVQEPRMK